jgi:alkanesulfonate monooxygenase SsuD/methylene tetrahydromethanopterin reductase-like flavin-dependent oxidoreductase (luciferase family)
LAAALSAEGAGFDSGWMTDHIIVPAQLAPIYGTISEALVPLGFLVPHRNPFVALKQLTSLDLLSGGGSS